LNDKSGGDGTINAVASAIVGHSSIRLGILPMGTLNHFARDLDISFDIAKAVEFICAGYSEAKDVGAVNELFFVNNASVGLYPAIVKMRESLQISGYTKWLAALISTFRAASSFRRFELEIQTATTQPIKIKTVLLFVGNNAYDTVVTKMGTRSALDRGMLWIHTHIFFANWSFSMFRGQHGTPQRIGRLEFLMHPE
jgi:diacylglycerol kinase family enzyme